jgi:hypothetical protein
MATVPALSLIRRATTRGGLLALPLVAALVAGCVTTDEMLLWKSEKKPEEPVCQLLCMWQNSVQFAADPTRGGKPGPGVAGRLYLFGKALGHPLRAEGSLVVDLFDETDGKPVHKEQWRIDPETLQQLVSKDFVGTGYTLFLPSHRYRPEMSKVRLRVAFVSATNPAPIFTENAITLADGNGVIHESSTSQPMTRPMPNVPAGPLGVNPALPVRPPMLPAPTPGK